MVEGQGVLARLVKVKGVDWELGSSRGWNACKLL